MHHSLRNMCIALHFIILFDFRCEYILGFFFPVIEVVGSDQCTYELSLCHFFLAICYYMLHWLIYGGSYGI